MRIQLAFPNNDFLSAERYNQIFTVHGSVMMFLFAVPIFEAFSILILPQMLGARDLPFPRLSAFGFWSFVIGGVFLCGSLFFDAAPRGGWFMYPPLTSRVSAGHRRRHLAARLLVHRGRGDRRGRGADRRRAQVPAAGHADQPDSALLLVHARRGGDGAVRVSAAHRGQPAARSSSARFDWPFFDPARGGDPLLWQHLFWIFGHPEVYIVFLPSVALVAMIVPTFARTPIVGYSWIVLAAVGTGFLSFGLWVHHMFTTGLPGISLGVLLGGVAGGRDSDRRAVLLLPRDAARRPRRRDRCRCCSSSAAWRRSCSAGSPA